MELVGTSSMEAAATSAIKTRMQRKRASSTPMLWISAMHSEAASSQFLIFNIALVMHCASYRWHGLMCLQSAGLVLLWMSFQQ